MSGCSTSTAVLENSQGDVISSWASSGCDVAVDDAMFGNPTQSWEEFGHQTDDLSIGGDLGHCSMFGQALKGSDGEVVASIAFVGCDVDAGGPTPDNFDQWQEGYERRAVQFIFQ